MNDSPCHCGSDHEGLPSGTLGAELAHLAALAAGDPLAEASVVMLSEQMDQRKVTKQ